MRRRMFWARLGYILVCLLFCVTNGCRKAVPELVLPNAQPPLAPTTAAETGTPMSAATPTVVRATPLPTPTRMPPESTAISYTVRYGDTLSAIATAYGATIETLLEINRLQNPDQLVVGQVIQVTLDTDRIGPGEILLPDSEAVYGPSYTGFDIAATTSQFTGMFRDYVEDVNGRPMTAAEIVQLVAEQYSVGPRVLLVLLELRGGWLTNPNPDATEQLYPLGYDANEYLDGLYLQLGLAANAVNAGFYDWFFNQSWLLQLGNGEYVRFSTSLNAATAGVQRALAAGAANYDAWVADLQRFSVVYRQLFVDPFMLAAEPLLPPDLTAPALTLPWPEGEVWYFTGGPHPGWGTAGAWSALDFATSEKNLGCLTSRKWVTAAAPGQVIISRVGEVWQDLDGDGFLGTGWVLLYMHVASEGRVTVGETLGVGDYVGHPSCEGGVANATHLHLAWRYNGVWIPAHDPRWPLTLSGWTATSDGTAYDGTLLQGDQVRVAAEDWIASNAVYHNPASP